MNHAKKGEVVKESRYESCFGYSHIRNSQQLRDDKRSGPHYKRYQWLGPVIDVLIIAVAVVTTSYLAYYHVGIAERLGRTLPRELWCGLVLMLVLLEATRRAVGWPLPLIAVGFLLYGFYGNLIPGELGHRAYSMDRMISQIYLSTEGIFGVALGVSAGFLFLFVTFATFLKESGGGMLFTDFATGLAGRAISERFASGLISRHTP